MHPYSATSRIRSKTEFGEVFQDFHLLMGRIFWRQRIEEVGQ